jgi:hypothetical protein
MKDANPLIIQLYNMDESVINRFNNEKLTHSAYRLNGIVDLRKIHEIPYKTDLPSDIHEADFIVIDTAARFQDNEDSESLITIQPSDEAEELNILPFDIHSIMESVWQTNHNQCVIFFMNTFFEKKYTTFIQGESKPLNIDYNVTGIFYNQESSKPIFRQGNFFSSPEENKYDEITNLLKKYLKNSDYSVVFPFSHADIVLLLSKSGEIVSKVNDGYYKKVFYFPNIKDKAGFLAELFTTTFPSGDYGFITRNLSDYGDFKWINDFPYLSHNERTIKINIEMEKTRHANLLKTLEENLSNESQITENIRLKKLLTETGNELKESVEWFLEYIGFDNILNPDEEANDKILEEDIRVVLPDITYIIETKGLGGTSTDADCAQPSKIVLRKQDADQANNNGVETVNYKAVYIVNSQRYKEPKVRDTPPFKSQQIEDARIARRAMTTTYELFNAFHMIEAGVLSKIDVQNAFRQSGLINFKSNLSSLLCDTRFDGPSVYSFDLTKKPMLQIDENDSIAFQDEDDHWYLSSIESMQINNCKVSSATASSGASVGIKLKKYIKSAKNFYLIKN